MPRITDWKHLDLNYKIVARINHDKCIGCDFCYIACWDGAHQCIHLDGHARPRASGSGEPRAIAVTPIAKLDAASPRRAHAALAHSAHGRRGMRWLQFCWLVCPVENCITMEKVDTGRPRRIWAQRTCVRHLRMPNTLIRNGKVVTATETKIADVLIEGEVIKEVRAGIPVNRRQNHRRVGHVRDAGRHRLPHSSGHAVRRHDERRRFRDGHARGGLRRHHEHRRFCDPGARHQNARRLRHVAEKAEGKACIDYGLHMIVTDLGVPAWKTWTKW